MSDDAALAEALGQALTGERLQLTSPGLLEGQLAELGYDRRRLGEIRGRCQELRAAWPFDVDLDTRRAIGFARFDAALAEARSALGLDGLRPTMPTVRPLDRDDRRLTEDRPPHWG